jgi:hypothetical protein
LQTPAAGSLLNLLAMPLSGNNKVDENLAEGNLFGEGLGQLSGLTLSKYPRQ